MNDKTIVNGEYLNELLNTMNKKGLDIEDIKEETLLPTLKELDTYLANNNKNQTDKINNIKTKISEVEKDIKKLTTQLESIIIPGYEDTNNSIRKHFNIDFHEEMDDFLKIINTK